VKVLRRLKTMLAGAVWGALPDVPPTPWHIRPILNSRPTPCRMCVPVRRNKLVQGSAIALWLWWVFGDLSSDASSSETIWLQWNIALQPMLLFVVWINRPRWSWREFASIEAAVEFKREFYKNHYPNRDPDEYNSTRPTP
jgi:hypothetical protein